MNRQRVLNIIREPLRMEHEKDLPLIKELIEEFPYFSAPYALLTKLLSEQKSIYLDKYLKLSAGYIGNREVLYNLIHSPMIAKEPEPEIAVEAQAPVANVLADENIEEPTTETIPEPAHISPTKKIVEAPIQVEEEQPLAPETVSFERGSTTEIAPHEHEINVVAGNEEEEDENSFVASEIPTEEINPETPVTIEPDLTEELHMPGIEKIPDEVTTPEEAKIISAAERESAEENVVERVEEEQEISVDERQTELPQVIIEENPVEENKAPEEVIQVEEQELPAAKKNPTKDIDFGLPPLAAYDYFAFQEKSKPKSASPEPETPVIAQEIAEEPKNHFETAANLKVENASQGSLKFADWLKSLSANNASDAGLDNKHVEIQAEAPVNIEVKPEKIAETPQAKPERKPKRDEVENLISKFIQSEPRIKPKPAKFFTPQDVAERSAEEDRTLVTETLANIYLKQGLNEKAIEIFKQLMLKYPQKSAYFAVKINEINTNP